MKLKKRLRSGLWPW